MRYFWTALIFLCVSTLSAAEPLFNDYEDSQNVWSEFRNVYDSQNVFEQVKSTPALSGMKDGEMVVYSSGVYLAAGNVHLILRVGTTLYYSPNFKLIPGR